MVCGWAFLPEQYQRMLQGIAFFHVNILLLYPVLLLTGMNTVDTCLVSNDIDTFLEACTLNSSGFAGTLVVGKIYKIVFSDFFSLMKLPVSECVTAFCIKTHPTQLTCRK